MDYFSQLPLELKEYIFKFLSGDDLWTCFSVSAEWRRIANFGKQWKNICSYGHIDTKSSIEEEDIPQALCKYALLWKQNAQTIKKWRTNSFREHIIPFKSDNLSCRRIYIHKNKMALITTDNDSTDGNIQIHSFGRKSYSINEIPLSFSPHSVMLNDDYVIMSCINIVICYKREREYELYFGAAFSDDSQFHLTTEDIPEFALSKLKTKIGPYVRIEVLSNEYLWLSCLNSTCHLLYVVNLQTLDLLAIDIISKHICYTKKYVVVATDDDKLVFTFKGELVSKLNVPGWEIWVTATDEYIVTSRGEGQPVTVWTIDGKKLHEIPGLLRFVLDPVRHLLYECTEEVGGNSKMNAICLRTGDHAWFVEMQKTRFSEVDDMFQVCDKFLIIDVCKHENTPNSHYAYVFDLDKRMLLYKAGKNSYTMRVSDSLWVLKTEDGLTVQIY